MKKSLYFAMVTAFLAAGPGLYAQSGTTGSGSMAMSGTIVPSISLTFGTDGSGISVTGAGTSSASIALGSVQAFGGSVPANVTKNLVGTGPAYTAFTLATPFDVLVTQANLTSSNYTLTAELTTPDSNNTWSIDGTPVTGTSAATITGTGSYDTSTSHSLLISIPFSNNTALSLSNGITFVATSN